MIRLELMRALKELIHSIEEFSLLSAGVRENVHPKFYESARNLVHYLALRTADRVEIQDSLSQIGLSSLTNPEAYTYRNICDIIKWLDPGYACYNESISFEQSRRILRRNKNRLFGMRRQGQVAHVMVTLPTAAAEDPDLVRGFMERGMDIARINLGHDRQEEWRKMVYNVRSASIELGLSCKIYMDLAGPKIRVKEYASGNSDGEMSRKPPKLFRGDSIRLVRQEAMLSGPVNDEQNTYSVTLEQILNDVRINDLISFDDGKLGGIIREKSEHHVLVEIIRSPIKGHRLRPEKGINLPMTPLSVLSLTTEDILNLDFVAKNADVVGYSFVRCMKDVEKLIEELDTRKCSKELGIVLKIENNDAFNNLPNLLLTAMQFRGVGVMLARGDLAVELGFEKFSEVQDEIISICEAAHVPVIWATQVLENLAKKGIATRAEVSDVMMAARSECVMLNKGPYINDALDVLLKILKRVRDHRVKGKNRIRELPLANSFFQKINPEEVVSC